MKTWHFIFESILMLITLAGGAACIVSDENFLGFAGWLMILGFSQVFHSFLIAALYQKNQTILKWIFLYWAGVLLDFILLFSNLGILDSLLIARVTVLVFPLILASYLWFITWHFRRRAGPIIRR